MGDLVDRYLLSIGNSVDYHATQVQSHMKVEDDFCSSGELGLVGCVQNEMEPFDKRVVSQMDIKRYTA